MKCKWCNREFDGNKKKQFCSDSCRVYSHRESKWININNLTEQQKEKIRQLWKTRKEES